VLPAGYRQDDLGSGDRAVQSVPKEPVTDAGTAKTEDVQNLRGGSAEPRALESYQRPEVLTLCRIGGPLVSY
jgi:hypothetical protein